MRMTLEERERFAYVTGDLRTALLLGVILDIANDVASVREGLGLPTDYAEEDAVPEHLSGFDVNDALHEAEDAVDSAVDDTAIRPRMMDVQATLFA